MSAQGGKKKRLGSRRRGANLNESKAPDITDGSSVAQHHIPEENTESLLANPDNSQPETQRSPEPSGSRRKLGSSRRSKGQRVQDSETESYHKPKEGVEGKIRENETAFTQQMSAAIQPEWQEASSQGSDDMPETHDGNLCSAMKIDYSPEVQTGTKVSSDLFQLVETMQEGIKTDSLHSEEVKDSAHLVDITDFTTSNVVSCPTVPNSMEVPQEIIPNVMLVTEKESEESDDNTELLRQDVNLKYPVESVDMQFTSTPEITTDSSVGQATTSSPKEELFTEGQQTEYLNVSEVRGADHSEEAVNKLHEQEVKPTEYQEMLQIHNSSESETHDATENPEIDQSDLKEMSDEELVCSVTEKENKERDEDTELFGQDENLQENSLVSDDIESSITPEISSEKSSLEQQTETEYRVEQAAFSASTEELNTTEGQNEIFKLSEVRGGDHLEEAVNKLHEQEVKPTEYQEMPQIHDSSESLTHNATENSDPDNKQDEAPAKENNFEVLEQKNEDDHVYDTKEAQISDIERVDTAPGQVYEAEGQVEDDIKPSAEQTAHQEKEGLFSEMDDSESSLQTLQSQINAPLDSQPEQNHSSFNPTGKRRKLGSSRRNKGRQQVKDSNDESHHKHREGEESTRNNEAFKTSEMFLTTEGTSQTELSEGSEHDVMPATHDSSLYSAMMSDYSSEIQSPITTNYPEADMKSLIPQSESLQKEDDGRETHFKVELSDKSAGATLEGSDKSDPLQSQEVRGADHSEEAVNKLQEQEVKPTEYQEILQIQDSSESETHDATENSEIISDQPDESPTNQDSSDPDNKQDEAPAKENNFEVLEQKNEDDHVYDTKEAQISDRERVDTAPGQVYEAEGQVEDDIKPSAEQTAHQEKEGLFSEMEDSESSLQTLQSQINAPLDSQSEQNHSSFNPTGNRRKLGSSRRNKGRQQVKDSDDESHHKHREDEESTRNNEAFKTTEVSLTTEGTSQTELREGSEHDVMSATHDSSLYSAMMSDYSSEIQSPITTNYPEADMKSLIPQSESLQKDDDGRETHFKVELSDKSAGATLEGSDKSDSLQSQEVRGADHSEEAVNKLQEQEVKPTEYQEILQIHHITENNEAFKTTEMSLTTETAVQEPSVEDMLEEMDKFDTARTEDVRDEIEENTLVDTDLHSSSTTADQQTIDRSDFREMSNEGLVCSVTEKENKERDDDTELFRQDENLQENSLVSNDIESSITPEISSEKSSSEQQTETEYSVEQAAFSASTEELLTTEGQNEIFGLPEVRGADHSEEAVNKLHEQEVKPTEYQEMLQIQESSESETHDATENSDPDNKQNETPAKENNFEVLEQKNEDDLVYDTKEAQISDIERVDTAPGQVYEAEGQVEDDIKPSTEQTAHQEREGLYSEMEDSESSSQILQSQINAPLDSQPEQNHSSFIPTGNRRKLGSSRRNKGRQQVKDSDDESHHKHREDEESTRNNEAFKTTEMSLTTETAVQEASVEDMLEEMDKSDTARTEDVREEIEENTLVDTDLHSSSTTADQQTIKQSDFREMSDEELVCSVTEKENKERDDDTELFRQDENRQENSLVSDDIESSITPEISSEKSSSEQQTETEYSVEQAAFSASTEELSANEEQKERVNLSQVRGADHSEEAVNKLHKQGVKPTEYQEMLQIHDSSESETHDATENSEIISDQPDESPTNQDSSDPDNKQNEAPAKENNFEGLEQKNEDDHVYDTKEAQISDIERVDTAPGQVYEAEGQVEDDIKPSAEQTAHQEREGLFSEMDDSESSLQILQSQINAPLDSQPEQNHSSFIPTGNRRKLGSSRRNKGRQQVKDSDAESHHKHREDEESTRNNEAFKTTEMSLTTETAVQEASVEDMLEEMDKSDTVQTEDGREKIEENTLVDTDLHSSSTTADQQTIDQTDFREMSDEELVCSVTEKENKERDEDTELFRQHENLQENSLVSDDIESSITPEISSEKSSSEQQTEPEYSVEQAAFPASTEELNTTEGQNEIFSLPEVRGADHSEEAVNKLHEQEVKPTEYQEILQIQDSSESETHDATENSEIISDQPDESPTNQDSSGPDNKQDEAPAKENNFEVLEQKNEDYHVYDTKEAQISDIERVDTAPGQVYEAEGQVEDDIKPSAEQRAHQEKEGLFSEMEDSESSLQNLQSEINTPLDSQPEQNHSSFNPTGNRRKLGSSRRNKGRQQVKDSDDESHHKHREGEESTRNNEAFKTTEVSLTTEGMAATHDSSLYSAMMSDYSSEIQSPITTNYPEADMKSLIPQSESLQKDHEEGETHFKVEVSDKSAGATLEGSDKSDSLQSQEVRGADHSEEAVNKLHEQEVKPTEYQEILQIQDSSESETHDATENSEIISDQPDESPTNQDSSGPDNKQDEAPAKENNFEVLEQKNEDYHVYDTKEAQISDIERVDTAPGQVYEAEGQVEDDIKPSAEQRAHQEKEGLFSEMEDSESSLQNLQSEINTPLDSQPEQNHSSFNPTGNRRKLGSSRRNKGRQQVKDSDDESHHKHREGEESTRNNEAFKTTEVSLTTEGMAATHDSSLYSAMMSDYSSEIQSPITTNYPEADMKSLIPQSESLQKDHEEGETHFKVEVSDKSAGATLEGSDKSDPLQSQEVRGADHSEEAVNKLQEQEAKPTEYQEMLQIHSVNLSQVRGADHSEDAVNKVHEEKFTSAQMQVIFEDSVSSLETLQSKLNAPLDNYQSTIEQTHTDFSPTRNRRKLGSSRRNKGRLHVKDTTKTDIQSISYHDDDITTRSIASDDLEQEGASQVQNTDASETVGDVTTRDTGAESSAYVQGYGQGGDGEKNDNPTKKDHKSQGLNVSLQSTQAELPSAAQNKNETMALFDFGLEENVRAGQAKDVSGNPSQQEIEEKMTTDNSENLQGRSQQKRRKMGSTRRIQLNRQPEEKDSDNFETRADVRNLDRMEVVEELMTTVTAEVTQTENGKPEQETSTVCDKEQKLDNSKQSNIKSHIDCSVALLPEQSVSHNEQVLNPVGIAYAADKRGDDVSEEPSQLSTNTEDTTNSDITGGFVSSGETTQSTQKDEERPESVNITLDQVLTSAVPVVSDLETVKSVVRAGGEGHVSAQASQQEANEGAHNKNVVMKNTSPNLVSTSRRKLGSTRRNLGSRNKQKDLDQNLEVDDEATHVGDVKTKRFITEDDPQLHTEHKGNDTEMEEYSHTGESHLKPLDTQMFEKNPVSPGKLVETDHQVTPTYLPTTPSTSAIHDLKTESSPGGRRRKLGSHRKSHGHKNQTAERERITDTENGRDIRNITEENAIKTSEELRGRSLDKIPEVNKSDEKQLSSSSSSREGEHRRPESEEKPEPVQHLHTITLQGQETQHKFSLDGPRGAELRSKAYNVMMVGDSSVGKTSFMKRAQSGKFSLDLPASVGLDSCMWTVVVDGKPVALHLWDTAGQERFHSVTRQIFHKAHAFLLMYDITSSQSFSAVSYWASCIQEGAAENVTILLVGNKSDRADRKVNTHEAEVLAKEYNFEFMECSAATGENVLRSLETVARTLSQRADTREDAMLLHKDPRQKKSSGCC